MGYRAQVKLAKRIGATAEAALADVSTYEQLLAWMDRWIRGSQCVLVRRLGEGVRGAWFFSRNRTAMLWGDEIYRLACLATEKSDALFAARAREIEARGTPPNFYVNPLSERLLAHPIGDARVVGLDELPTPVAIRMSAAFPHALLFAVVRTGETSVAVYPEGSVGYERRVEIGKRAAG